MPTFEEMNKKVTISIGLIIALIIATFLVTSFYFETTSLSSRLDKRYNRLNDGLTELNNKFDALVLEMLKPEEE